MIELVKQKREGIAEHCRRLNVRKLDLFGSAAKGTFDPERSDLDFLVEFNDYESPGIATRYFDLAESLEALFNRKVDLVTIDCVTKPRFKANVEAEKEPVYVS
jgi:hypothetical protein